MSRTRSRAHLVPMTASPEDPLEATLNDLGVQLAKSKVLANLISADTPDADVIADCLLDVLEVATRLQNTALEAVLQRRRA